VINTKSIAFRNSIIYLLLFLVGIGLVGVLMFRYSAKAILDSAEKDVVHRSELVEVKINEYINGLVNDISYLADSPILGEYLDRPTPINYRLLSQDYLSLIKSKSDFSQIRFIGVDNEGKEIVRVDRDDSGSKIAPSTVLQSKGDRSYFREALILPPSEIYFSRIDLNREFGEISIPYTPTLRVAKPIYRNGIKQGVIVVNSNLDQLFDQLSNLVGNDYALRIINPEGYYIMHESTDSTFIFDTEVTAHPQVKDMTSLEMSMGDVVSDINQLYVTNLINISDQYKLTQTVVADKSYILDSYYHWRNNSLMIILAISFLFLAVAFYILNRQAKRLGDITRGMLDFSTSRAISNLPTERSDEIGYLARSLNDMATIVNDQIDTVESAKDKAETAVREKSEFIENMSHEIRNPLQSIIGLTSMLKSNNPTPSQQKLIDSLIFNTTNLNSLVNNILDFQNVISGNLTLKYNWYDLRNLVVEVVNSNKYAAISKNISIQFDISNHIESEEYRIDSLRLVQILNNLISNAIKYTEVEGSVNVKLVELSDLLGRKTLRFSVIDTGIGLTESEILRMKERYVTGGGVDSLSSSFGLGLSIVNELLAYFGSRLQVTSTKDEGSTFYFDLDVEWRAATLDNSNLDSESKMPPMDVLIIDDDPQIIEVYKHFFEHTEVRTTYHNEVPSSRDIDYDLIISDYRLENTTLLDEKEKLLSLANKSTPLIIVSATVPDVDVLSADIDCVYYLSKPFQLSDLKLTIARVLVFAKFGIPTFESIKSDYDYQEQKYNRAISLLRDEWKSSMNTSIIRTIRDNDVQEYKNILHKIITSLRRMGLVKLEQHLLSIQQLLESGESMNISEIGKLEEALQIYLQVIEQEIN